MIFFFLTPSLEPLSEPWGYVNPKASRKQHNSIPKSLKNDFHPKSIVAIPSTRKPRFGSPKRRNVESEIDEKMTWKQARKQNYV